LLTTLIIGLKIIIAMVIAIQDIRTRLISIYLLIGLFVVNFIGMLKTNGFIATLQLTALNNLLLGIIFGITFIYFKWVRKVEHPLITHLGWGDILFFIALTPLFYPLIYSYVFIAMTLVSTLVGLALLVVKGQQASIPHAGISALIFIVLVVSNTFFSLSLNDWLL
jgi:hypothetical protein